MIACFGGAHLDTKVHLLDAPRLATSNPAWTARSPGGVACNIARTLARLGADVVLCSMVGDDDAAASLRTVLRSEGIDTSGLLTHPTLGTAGYLAILEPGGDLVIGVADMEIYDAISEEWVDEAVGKALSADLWVVDANLPAAVLGTLVDQAPVPVLADPVSVAKTDRLRPILGRLAGVFPDRAEAAALIGGDPDDHETNAAAIVGSGTGTVVVSLGADGVYALTGEKAEARPAVPSERVVDVTGAGDALLAGYAYAVASSEADPLAWGMAVASLAVETDASVPQYLTRESVTARLGT